MCVSTNSIWEFGRSVGKCFRGMHFSALRSSMHSETSKYSYFGFTKDEDLSRGLTIAKLHASLHTIQQGIDAYDMQIELLEDSAKEMLASNCDPARVFSVFKRVRAANVQSRTAEKSKDIILGAIAAIVDQSQVQGITNLMQFTVSQHNLAHTGATTDDNHREKLIEAYEHITTSLVNNQDTLHTLDIQQDMMKEEHDAEDHNLHDNCSAFAKWTAQMQAGQPVVASPVVDNLKLQDEHAIKLLNQQHQRDQLDRSLQRVYN